MTSRPVRGAARTAPAPAPGARVVIRDAEWVIRLVDRAPDGGYRLVCDGVSELVREREAVFLTRLEPEVRVLDPADTRLAPDPSPGFADSLLYLESQLRQAVPNDERIHAAHGAAMDPVRYQFAPARQALAQPRQRILVADAVGLGKTLEAGILVSELIARGRGRRILVLAVKSMLTQFQKEFWNRFTIPLTRLDSVGIQRVRGRIPASHNPFHYYDKAIISIDTLKQDAEYRAYLEQAYWDVIVIDEAHNVADRGAGGAHGRTSLRSRLARLLARRSDTLIMLSATPHDGRARSFASLMNMLDATAIADPDDYSKDDFRGKGLVIRRFKKDVREQVRDAFRDREIVRRRFPASAAEEAAYEALLAVRVAGPGSAAPPGSAPPSGSAPAAGSVRPGPGQAGQAEQAEGGATLFHRSSPPGPAGGAGGGRRDLFLVTLEKALFSSPAACIASVDERLRRRERAAAAASDARDGLSRPPSPGVRRAAPDAHGDGGRPGLGIEAVAAAAASDAGGDGGTAFGTRSARAAAPDARGERSGEPPTARAAGVEPPGADTAGRSPASRRAGGGGRGRTAERRRRSSAAPPDARAAAEVESLHVLRRALAAIRPDEYAKYQALLAAVRGGGPSAWRADDPADRLVVFTERIETLRWLRERLAADLRLGPSQVEVLHGGLSDVDQQRVVDDFGNAARPLRLLICSDVASEGINLHYQCHRLVHFDLPWSLMVFQQRNGRVDRYGQERTPRIVYLVAESANETIRGDTRILEVLAEKDEQAHRNIGDPSAFLRVYDVEAEEEVTRRAVADGEDAERFDARLTPAASEGDDLLALFLGASPPPGDGADGGIGGTDAAGGTDAGGTGEGGRPAPPSLFENDLAYCEAALHRLRGKDRALRFETDAAGGVLTLDAPDDLRRRFDTFPREVFPRDGRLTLTADRRRMREAIAESRRDEAAWPAVHWLWRLNPVVGWLNDRMTAAFGRHEAPVLAGVPGLAADEAVFVLSGLVPNRRGHPLLYEWVAVTYRGERHEALLPFDELLARTGLGRRAIANRGRRADLPALRSLLPDAVARARARVVERRRDFEDRVNDKLNRELAALEALKARRIRRIEKRLERSDQSEAFKRARAERARRDVETIFDEYLTWVEDTMTTEPQPYMRVACVMTGEASEEGPALPARRPEGPEPLRRAGPAASSANLTFDVTRRRRTVAARRSRRSPNRRSRPARRRTVAAVPLPRIAVHGRRRAASPCARNVAAS